MFEFDEKLRATMFVHMELHLPLLALTARDMVESGVAGWVDVSGSEGEWGNIIIALVPVTDGSPHVDDYLIMLDEFDDITVNDEKFLPCARGEYPPLNGAPRPGSLTAADREFHHERFCRETSHQLLASRDLYSGWSQRSDFTPARRREYLQIASVATEVIIARMGE